MNSMDVVRVLARYRFSFTNEISLQDQIEHVLKLSQIPYRREHRLSDSDIVDFFIDGVAMEVKIKGHPVAVYQQCVRYGSHDSVKEVLLVSAKNFALPDVIGSKPAYVYFLSAL